MAMYTDIAFNKVTGQYEFHFVNQQYDSLMVIAFDKTTNSYRLDCSEEEARKIALSWSGREMDVELCLKEAAEALEKKKNEIPE